MTEDFDFTYVRFWKQARGDHMLVSAFVTSVSVSYLCGMYLLNKNIGFFLVGSLLGFFIPLWFVSTFYSHWINNEIPKHHFWRDLLT